MLADKSKKVAGDIGSLGLTDLIQLLGMTGRTATLILDRGGLRGRIFVDGGNVLHAEAGRLEGRKAFTELMQWTDAEFVLEDGVIGLPKVTVSESASGLMLSTLTQMDEDSSDSFVPPRDTRSSATSKNGPIKVVRRPSTGIPVPQEAKSGVAPMAAIAVGALLLGVALAVTLLRPGSQQGAEQASAAPVTTVPEAPPTSMEVEDLDPTDVAASATKAAAPASRNEEVTREPVPPPPAAPAYGFLQATSGPGLRVSIDGKPLQGPPFARLRLAPGAHEAEIAGDFVGTAREVFRVTAGETLMRRFAPVAIGYLKVIAIPWAEVFIDGAALGQTPIAKVEVVAGPHTVVLRNPQLGERTEQIVITAGETNTLRVEMSGS